MIRNSDNDDDSEEQHYHNKPQPPGFVFAIDAVDVPSFSDDSTADRFHIVVNVVQHFILSLYFVSDRQADRLLTGEDLREGVQAWKRERGEKYLH